VLCESGAYYSGHVEEVDTSSSEVLVSFDSRELPLSRFPLSSAWRPPPATSHPRTHSFSIGEEVEVHNTARDSEAFGCSGATWPSSAAPGLQPRPPLPPIQYATHPGQGLLFQFESRCPRGWRTFTQRTRTPTPSLS
ncbi:Fragile X mental retardation syndrome-related protein 1, partial [Caligus rogercresseyi]